MMSNSQFDRLMSEAVKHIGKPYDTGNGKGNGPDKFDCSGFVRWVYTYSGVYNIMKPEWRSSWQMVDAFKRLESIDMKRKGDVLFFRGIGDAQYRIGHVGIYLGDNRMLHATTANGEGSVCFADISENKWRKRLVSVGRVPSA